MKSNTSKKVAEIPCEKKIKCRILQIEGTKYRTTFTKKFENRVKYVPLDPRLICTYLPGTVINILVKEGQKVKQGDNIIIFEAMKMRNKIASPLDGKIKALSVTEGSVIVKGQLIAEIEPANI